MYFIYGEKEIEYLKSKDKKLAEIINTLGHLERSVDSDLFSSVIHNIIGQQISMKAEKTIWQRMINAYGTITPKTIGNANINELQSLGITGRKAEYIWDFSVKVLNNEFDLDAVKQMSDKEAIAALSALKGIGVWTAEMILLFCLQRKDILSYSDLAILRGLRMIYHHRNIDRKLFEKYQRRFSPYGSIASLYLWEVANGAIPEMKDYAPKKKTKQKK